MPVLRLGAEPKTYDTINTVMPTPAMIAPNGVAAVSPTTSWQTLGTAPYPLSVTRFAHGSDGGAGTLNAGVWKIGYGESTSANDLGMVVIAEIACAGHAAGAFADAYDLPVPSAIVPKGARLAFRHTTDAASGTAWFSYSGIRRDILNVPILTAQTGSIVTFGSATFSTAPTIGNQLTYPFIPTHVIPNITSVSQAYTVGIIGYSQAGASSYTPYLEFLAPYSNLAGATNNINSVPLLAPGCPLPAPIPSGSYLWTGARNQNYGGIIYGLRGDRLPVYQ